MALSSICLKGRLVVGRPAALHHAQGGRQHACDVRARWLLPQRQDPSRDLLSLGHRRAKVRPSRATGTVMDGSTSTSKKADGIVVPSIVAAEVEKTEQEASEVLAEEVDDEEDIVVVKEPVRQQRTRGLGDTRASVRQEAPPVPAASSYPGSPIFWVAVGVALAIGARWVVGQVRDQALKAAMKTMMGSVGNGGSQSQFGMPGPGPAGPMPWGIPGMPTSGMPGMPTSGPSSPKATVTDTTATPVQKAAEKPKSVQEPVVQEGQPSQPESAAPKRKKGGFRDVKEQELQEEEQKIKSEPKRETFQDAEVLNAGTSTSGESTAGTGGPDISMEHFEKLLEDPTMQQLIYPYLPENMRNPDTFKWMMQNPMYKQEVHKMFSQVSSGGNADLLKNLDLNSPDMKAQFDDLGMKPEDLLGKLMADPSIAMALQNPRILSAIMEVSSNPMLYSKYQNDKEVMDVFQKLYAMFPGQ